MRNGNSIRLVAVNSFEMRLLHLIEKYLPGRRVRNDSAVDCAHGMPLRPKEHPCRACREFHEHRVWAHTRAESDEAQAIAARCVDLVDQTVAPSELGKAELIAMALAEEIMVIAESRHLAGAEERMHRELYDLLFDRLYELRRLKRGTPTESGLQSSAIHAL